MPEDRKPSVSQAFVVVDTPEQAVDRLAALHEQATGALSQALKRYLKDRTEPDDDQRALAFEELRTPCGRPGSGFVGHAEGPSRGSKRGGCQ